MLELETFRSRLAERGYRSTPQRVAIYRLLAHDKSHPTAEDVHRRLLRSFPTVSLATVYNTLELFVELGLAVPLGFEGERRHYDGNPQAHVNLRCRRCGRIQDLDESGLEAIARRVAERSGFELIGQRHEFYGLCPECRSTASAHSEANPAPA
ncbi:MAG TPA: Fur family transcriptional regulator [Limnochordia bacterium]|nr:Fur family transcriptional regulator [Limnochordia bacterium]